MLTVTPASIAANAGAANNLNWAFNSGSEAFDYLDDGESLTLTYTVRATDDSAGHDDQTVTITITGTNDAPVITAATDVAETLAETECRRCRRSGSFVVGDVDTTDVVSITGVTLATSGNDDRPGAAEQCGAAWDVLAAVGRGDRQHVQRAARSTGRSTPAREAFDYLDDDESLTLTYTVTLTDDNVAPVTTRMLPSPSPARTTRLTSASARATAPPRRLRRPMPV